MLRIIESKLKIKINDNKILKMSMTHTGRTATVKLLENRYTFRKQEHKSLCVWLEIKKWNGNRYHFLKKEAYIDPTRMSTVLLYTSDPLFSRPST